MSRFDIQGGGYDSSIPTSGEFIIPNGESLIAVLNDDLSTRNAQEGQTFTATVRQPSSYEGALLLKAGNSPSAWRSHFGKV